MLKRRAGWDGFRHLPNGQSVWYPWCSRIEKGYLITSQEVASRLRSQIIIATIVTSGLMCLAMFWGGPAVLTTGGACVLVYGIWVRRVVAGLTPFVDPDDQET